MVFKNSMSQDEKLTFTPDGVEGVLDMKTALTIASNSRKLLEKLALLFIEEGPERLRSIEKAVSGRDGLALEQASHSLIGSANIFAAESVLHAALELEKMGRANDFTRAVGAYEVLETEFERLKAALHTLVADSKA